MEAIARLALAENQAERAARLLGAADARLKRLDSVMKPIEHALMDQTIARLRAVLSEDTFTAAWEDGHAMKPDQAVAYALEMGA
jgi:cytochrome c553